MSNKGFSFCLQQVCKKTRRWRQTAFIPPPPAKKNRFFEILERVTPPPPLSYPDCLSDFYFEIGRIRTWHLDASALRHFNLNEQPTMLLSWRGYTSLHFLLFLLR